MAFKRIMVLLWADILGGYAIWTLQTYLTSVWNLEVTHAAAIINISSGIAKALPLLFVFMVDSFLGDYLMLLFSSIAYTAGLGFLFLSTPPVLAKVTNTCNDYEPECIGRTQKALFYTALACLVVGISGHIVSLVQFAKAQPVPVVENGDADDAQMPAAPVVTTAPPFVATAPPVVSTAPPDPFQPIVAMFAYVKERNIQSGWIIILVLVPAVAIFALPYVNPWSVRFGVPALCAVVATLFFVTSRYEGGHETIGGPLTSFFRVIVASACNICQKHPENVQDLHEYDKCQGQYTESLRFLDKAAIVSNPELDKPQRSRWRLCTVTEVEEAKFVIRMIPLWITFIICGIISSLGNTYFVEQANNMNFKIGKLKLPITVLLFVYDSAKGSFTTMYLSVVTFFRLGGIHRYVPAFGMVSAIILSTLCCITAAKIENKRIHVITDHGLLDKPDDKIPMRAYWLLFQFILLAGHDSLANNSISGFFDSEAPESMKKYILYFTQAINGLGTIGSVLSVYLVGKASQKGGDHPNWFQDTLNRSRLDNYYWVLAVLSAASLVWYTVFALSYTYPKRV